MKTIIEVGPFECRWIEGDDGMCCAAVTKPGSSYCAEHHAICWVKPLPVKDKAPVREVA